MRGLKTTELFKQELSHQDHLHHISDEERVQLQQLLLEMFEDIKQVCTKKKIPYMAGGGTVLGAVRHQGYIPWDDDLDLNIERQYVSALLDGIREAYGDKYFILEPLNSRGYLSSFVQIQRQGTIMREYQWQKPNECGVKIDIFVIENTFNRAWRRKWHSITTDAGLFMLSCYRTLLWRKEFLELTQNHSRAKMVIWLKCVIGLPYGIAPKLFYKRLQKRMMCCKDTESKYVAIPSGRGHFAGEIYEREKFCPTREVPFEDTRIAITEDYDSYLRGLYGDNYMELPPQERREEHVLYQFEI